VRATNSNTEVQITGSNHIAADIHDLQSGVISAGDFAANAITASALAADAVTEIQSGLATSAALATESTKLNRIEAVATGTVTGAGTSTEVFVGPSATLTITVDSSGNRSAVVVT
jgi:TRAP-type mannitol/chloroaromatic compound transport system substrate-binding protein